MSVYTTDPIEKHPSDNLPYAIIFTSLLNEPTLADGTTISSATVAADAGLTVASATVNSSATTDSDGESVPVGHLVQYQCSGGTAGTVYDVTVTATLSDGNTVARKQKVDVTNTT